MNPKPMTRHALAAHQGYFCLMDEPVRDAVSRLVDLEISPGKSVVAVSVLFRDEPFFIHGFCADGVVIRGEAGLRKVDLPELPVEIQEALKHLQALFKEDTRFLCACGDALGAMGDLDIEIRCAQAHLSPRTAAVVNVEGRLLGLRRKRKTTLPHRINFIEKSEEDRPSTKEFEALDALSRWVSESACGS